MKPPQRYLDILTEEQQAASLQFGPEDRHCGLIAARMAAVRWRQESLWQDLAADTLYGIAPRLFEPVPCMGYLEPQGLIAQEYLISDDAEFRMVGANSSRQPFTLRPNYSPARLLPLPKTIASFDQERWSWEWKYSGENTQKEFRLHFRSDGGACWWFWNAFRESPEILLEWNGPKGAGHWKGPARMLLGEEPLYPNQMWEEFWISHECPDLHCYLDLQIPRQALQWSELRVRVYTNASTGTMEPPEICVNRIPIMDQHIHALAWNADSGRGILDIPDHQILLRVLRIHRRVGSSLQLICEGPFRPIWQDSHWLLELSPKGFLESGAFIAEVEMCGARQSELIWNQASRFELRGSGIALPFLPSGALFPYRESPSLPDSVAWLRNLLQLFTVGGGDHSTLVQFLQSSHFLSLATNHPLHSLVKTSWKGRVWQFHFSSPKGRSKPSLHLDHRGRVQCWLLRMERFYAHIMPLWGRIQMEAHYDS